MGSPTVFYKNSCHFVRGIMEGIVIVLIVVMIIFVLPDHSSLLSAKLVVLDRTTLSYLALSEICFFAPNEFVCAGGLR